MSKYRSHSNAPVVVTTAIKNPDHSKGTPEQPQPLYIHQDICVGTEPVELNPHLTVVKELVASGKLVQVQDEVKERPTSAAKEKQDAPKEKK